MREHTHRLEVRLNDREYSKLKELTRRSALPTSTIIRKLIEDENIVEHPSVDYWKAYQSIEQCRRKLNLIKVSRDKCWDCENCREACSECLKIWRLFFDGIHDPSIWTEIINNEKTKEDTK